MIVYTQIKILIPSITCLILFQNCSRTNFSQASSDGSNELKIASEISQSSVMKSSDPIIAGVTVALPNDSLCANPTTLTKNSSLPYTLNKAYIIKGDNLTVVVDGARSTCFSLIGHNNKLVISDQNFPNQVFWNRIKINGDKNALEIDGFQSSIDMQGDDNSVNLVGHARGVYQNKIISRGQNTSVTNLNKLWQTTIFIYGNGFKINNQESFWQNRVEVQGGFARMSLGKGVNFAEDTSSITYGVWQNTINVTGDDSVIDYDGFQSEGFIVGARNKINWQGVNYDNHQISIRHDVVSGR